jgi:hypothetical protein
MRKQAYVVCNYLTKDLGTYSIHIPDMAQGNYNPFPAMTQSLERSRFKNVCQVDAVVPLWLIL